MKKVSPIIVQCSVDLISAFSRGGVAAVVDKVILKGRLKSIGQWMWLSW